MDIHAAALNGDVGSVCRYVVGAGDPNLLNEAGITPLHRFVLFDLPHTVCTPSIAEKHEKKTLKNIEPT